MNKKIGVKGELIMEHIFNATAAHASQIEAMWKAAEANFMLFARMIESYHGIGEVTKEEKKDV